MNREMSEVEVLESEIERLEDEYYDVYDQRAALDIDDPDYEGKISWFNQELESIESEIQNLREEVSWLTR